MRRKHGGVVGLNVNQDGLTIAEETISSVRANATITINPNGSGEILNTGNVVVNNNSKLRLSETTNTNYVEIKAYAGASNTVTYQMPDSGLVAGYALATDAGGNLYWMDPEVDIDNETNSSQQHFVTFVETTAAKVTNFRTTSAKLNYVPASGLLTVGDLYSQANVHANGAIYTNNNSLTSDYTVTSSTNAMSSGPITIASGVTMTVQGNWSVV